MGAKKAKKKAAGGKKRPESKGKKSKAPRKKRSEAVVGLPELGLTARQKTSLKKAFRNSVVSSLEGSRREDGEVQVEFGEVEIEDARRRR